MILLILFAALVGTTLLEFYVVIQVGQAIGVLPTLALMLGDAALGSVLMRAQGRAVWRRFRSAVAAGQLPGREVLDGMLVVAGGAFLITPGFVTDLFGALLLLPPTRAVARRLLVRHLGSRLVGGLAAPLTGRRGPGPFTGAGGARRTDEASRPQGRTADVDGTAVEVPARELRP